MEKTLALGEQMKIKVSLKLVLYKSDEEMEIPDGSTVQNFMNGFIPGLPKQAHKMLVDQEGVFRGVVLLNKSRADMNQILKQGDELTFLCMISGG